MKFSFFKNSRAKTPTHELSLNQIKQRIEEDPTLKQLSEEIRRTEDKKERSKLKQKLSAFTPSVTLSTRDKEVNLNERVISYNNILLADIDLETKEEALQLFKKLKKDKFVYFMFISVSGNGLAVAFKVEGGIEMHEDNFELVQEYIQEKYNVQIDSSCRDVVRLRYFSHSEFYENIGAFIFHFVRKETE